MAELLDSPDAMDYLRNVRGLSLETIASNRLGYVPNNFMDQALEKWTLEELKLAGLIGDKNYPLFFDSVLIPFYERERVVALRAKSYTDGRIIQAKDTSLRLFGVNNIRGHREVFICEGEMDALYLHQLGFPACAAPGAGVFQQDWVSHFDLAKRVFVCFDADDAGAKGAHRTAQLIGRKARIVELPVPNGQKSTDITEFFERDRHTKDEFEALVNAVRGERIYSVESALVERDRLLAESGLLTGLGGLDRALLPGLLPGQVVTVLAKTGAGKTAFISQLLHNMSSWSSFDGTHTGSSVPVLTLSLEQTRAELAERLERIGKLHNPTVKRDIFNGWYSSSKINDENKIPPNEVPILIEEFIDEVGVPPKVLMVDYLGYWSRAFPKKSKYEQVSEAIMELKRIAKENEVTVIAPHQVSRVGRTGERLELDFARDSGVVEETSDFVISLFKPGAKFDTEEDFDDRDWRQRADTRLEVLKSRHGGVGATVLMYWAPYSLALIERGSWLEQRVEDEYYSEKMGLLYDQVAKNHARGFVL
jgi:KaiC/GvpD/RAD55 family RecA-like ATPase